MAIKVLQSIDQVAEKTVSLKAYLQNMGITDPVEVGDNPIDLQVVTKKVQDHVVSAISNTKNEAVGDSESEVVDFTDNAAFEAFKANSEISPALLSNSEIGKRFKEVLTDSIFETLEEIFKEGEAQVFIAEDSVRYEALRVFDRDDEYQAQIIRDGEKTRSDKFRGFLKNIIPKICKSTGGFLAETWNEKGGNLMDENKQAGQTLFAIIGWGAAYLTQRSGVDLGVLSNIAIATLVATLLLAVQDFDKGEKWHQKVLAFTGAFSISHLISVAGFQAGGEVNLTDISPVDFARLLQAQGVDMLEVAREIVKEHKAASSDAFVGYMAPVGAMVATFGAYYGTGQMSRNARDQKFVESPMYNLIAPLTTYLKNELKSHDLADKLQKSIIKFDWAGVQSCFDEVELLMDQEQSYELSQIAERALVNIAEYFEDPANIYEDDDHSNQIARKRKKRGGFLK